MRLFRRGPSEAEQFAGLDLIRHIQIMYAYQQLTMERYNDALLGALGAGSPGSEFTPSAAVGTATPAAITEKVIPVLAFKRSMVADMEKQQVAFGRPDDVHLVTAYDDLSAYLQAVRARANAQWSGWLAWLADPTESAVDTRREDSAELQATDASNRSVNALIQRVGLTYEQWIGVNTMAFNAVRQEVGLAKFTEADFTERFQAGISGVGTARFFDGAKVS